MSIPFPQTVVGEFIQMIGDQNTPKQQDGASVLEHSGPWHR